MNTKPASSKGLTLFLFSLLISALPTIYSFQKTALSNMGQDLDQAQNDSLSIMDLLEKARPLIRKGAPLELPEQNVQRALSINSAGIQNNYLEARSRMLLGKIKTYRKQHEEAEKELEQALEVYQKTEKEDILLLQIYWALVDNYDDKGYDDKKSIQGIIRYAKEGLAACEKLGEVEPERINNYQQGFQTRYDQANAFRDIPLERIPDIRAKFDKAFANYRKAWGLHNREGAIDSAYYYYVLASGHFKEYLTEVNDPYGWYWYLINEAKTADVLDLLESVGKFKRGEGRSWKKANETLQIANSKLGPEHSNVRYVRCNLAKHLKKRDLEMAEEIFLNEAIDPGYDCLFALGWFYLSLQNYHKAIEVFTRLYDDASRDYERGLASQDLATACVRAGRFDKAEQWANVSSQMLKGKIALSHPRFAFNYHVLADVHADRGEFRKALPLIEKAESIMIGIAGEWAFDVMKMYRSHLKILQGMGEYERAHIYMDKVFRSQKTDPRLEWLSRIQTDAGHLLLAEGQLREALDSANASIRTVLPIGSTMDVVEYKKVLLSAIKLKADILFATYQKEGNINYLEQSFASYQEAIELVDIIRQSYSWSASKNELFSSSQQLFLKAIETGILLSKLESNTNLFHDIFRIAENQKSILLLEAIQNAGTRTYAEMPESLLNREENLQIKLNFYQQQLFTEQQRGAEEKTELIEFFKRKIYAVNASYDSLSLVIRKNYPEYYNLSHQITLTSVKSVQSDLKAKNAAMLHYLVADDKLIVFLIQPRDFEILEIPLEIPLEDYIQRFQKGAISFKLNNNASESLKLSRANTLVKTSHALYNQLLGPILAQHSLPDRLIIIPDGILGYLPFEALIKEPAPESLLFGSHHYVLQDHQISYAYSATSLQEMENRRYQKTKGAILAFAPSFEGEATDDELVPHSLEQMRGDLGPLRFNIEEAAYIQQMLGGELYAGPDATEANFLKRAPEFSIIHLATHGKANDKAGDFAFLAFAKPADTLDNDLLYNRDLYNLQLKADMVVLSACETGIGELQKGEGIISLARGFSYAGAKSIIPTLWSVNDIYAKELMEGFYTNLQKGLPKDAALQQAKLDFLDAKMHDAHPFFWAPFIAIGDMSPIRWQSSRRRIWVGLGLALLAFFSFYYFRK